MLTFKKYAAKKFAAVIIYFFISLSLFAQTLQHPDIEPLFTVQIKNPSKWTADEIFETALLFSECEKGSQSWNRCLQEFNKIKKEVTSSEYMKLSEEEMRPSKLRMAVSPPIHAGFGAAEQGRECESFRVRYSARNSALHTIVSRTYAIISPTF